MKAHAAATRSYFVIFAVLIACTILTTGVSFLNLGRLSTIVALTIALFKASLVLLYFMHLRASSRMVWVFAIAGLFWLGIMFTLSFSDYLTRKASVERAEPITQNAFYDRR